MMCGWRTAVEAGRNRKAKECTGRIELNDTHDKAQASCFMLDLVAIHKSKKIHSILCYILMRFRNVCNAR